MVKWLQSEVALVAEIHSTCSPESLPPWLPQLKTTTKETPTTKDDGDGDEDIAEGIPPVDAGTVANAEGVGASRADQSRAVISGGVAGVGSSSDKSRGKRHRPGAAGRAPAKPIPLKIVKVPEKGGVRAIGG